MLKFPALLGNAWNMAFEAIMRQGSVVEAESRAVAFKDPPIS